MGAHQMQDTKSCFEADGFPGLTGPMHRRAFIRATAALPFAATAVQAASSLAGVGARIVVDPVLEKAIGGLISQWITKSADAVRGYYGKFPVPVLDLNISGSEGQRVSGGHSEPGAVPAIDVTVGKDCSADALLRDDWVLVHEMIHMAIPYVPRHEFWAAEGLAVYVESICRIQAGHIPPEPAFADFVKRMPGGLPKQGEGLSSSRDHGRVYWGGALFFLLSDVRIRQATNNKAGLQTALRAINAKHDFREEMPVAQFFPIGDAATGTHVLMQLHDEMALKGGGANLPELWDKLGVRDQGDDLHFDDNAPLAPIRKAILTPLA